MQANEVQQRIDNATSNFLEMLNGEHWTLEYAHRRLAEGANPPPGLHGLDLFQIAGLAKAIAIVQCA